MKVDKYSIEGKVLGQVDLPDNIFGTKINDVIIYEYMKAANANLRQGTHKTKQRAEVRGGGAKPWRQKGTGRARAGTTRSPIWTGGGVVFGPKPRCYKTNLPKGIKKAAFKSMFSLKAKDGKIKVIEDFKVEGKTREMSKIGKALAITKGILITNNEDNLLKRSMSNLSWFNYNNVNRINGRDLFYSKEVVITESALKSLSDKYSNIKG